MVATDRLSAFDVVMPRGYHLRSDSQSNCNAYDAINNRFGSQLDPLNPDPTLRSGKMYPF